MYFAPNNAALPLELFCIRAAAAVQTPQERADLIAAWKLCLINGPSPLRRRSPDRPPRGGTFTKTTAGIRTGRVQQPATILALS